MKNKYNKNIIALLILFGFFFANKPVLAEIGFQPDLNFRSEYVSSYQNYEDGFSAALFPDKYPVLSFRLKKKNNVTGVNSDEKSIQLTTRLYSVFRENIELIPISIDIRDYFIYRKDQFLKDRMSETSLKAMQEKFKKNRSAGLGLNVALPKRLDQIFGEGGAGLKVSGYRKVSLAGRSTWTDQVESENYRQSRFPTLKMDQISRFNITGNIGSKITVRVAQDSQTDIPLANRIQIRYKGDDDDILKSIEAGNTTLALPNTQFVGYTSQIRGLFGLKAEAQVGNFRLVAIASQEKGSTERSSFSPTGEESSDYIRDYDYVERRIFDLGRKRKTAIGVDELNPGDSITNIYIFETASKASQDISGNLANFYVNPNFPDSFIVENLLNSGINRVDLVAEELYELYTIPSRNQHYIVFKSTRPRERTLGYWMEVQRADNSIDIIGDVSGDIFDLKLLAKSSSQPNPKEETWKLMWRNCYNIPRSSNIEDLHIKILYGLPGSEGTSSTTELQEEGTKFSTYLEIFGLDQYANDASGDKKEPDGIVDNRQAIFRSDWGLLIFPHRRPFDTDTTFTSATNVTTPELLEKTSKIYDFLSYTEKPKDSKYYIQLSTKSRSSIIKLNRANIIENSEKIVVNGRQLEKTVDYTIQYDFGQITLLSDEATDPNADIQIDYEYAPFFAVQKKSLLGLRGEYEWSRDFKFGSTFLYKSDKAQDRKPKVGQETARTIIFDADMQLKLHPNFLTKVVDALPLVETEAPSNLSISGEIAQSHPNPNVNNDAYVDDFEAALDYLSISTSRSTWKRSTKPPMLDENTYARGQLLWHNPTSWIPKTDVYDLETTASGNNMTTFRMIYRPSNFKIDTLSYDTTNLQLIDADTVAANSWGGIMRGFGSRVDSKRAQLFEVRAKARRGKLHFDFGIIDEDLNKDLIANSEDLPPKGNQNKSLEASEDVGLDGKADHEEFGYNATTNPDPYGDNWYFKNEGKCPLPDNSCDTVNWDDESHPLYYEYLNGTEGNIRDGGGSSQPDKETLDASFKTSNSYFSFEIDFESDSFLVEGSERDVDGDNDYNPWRTYRIPIKDTLALTNMISTDGAPPPDWTAISHIRVWFETDSFTTAYDTIEIADWGFVQSNWQDTIIYSPDSDRQTKFVVASVSEEDQTFVPPPEVEAYEDPTTNIREPQRGLLLEFTDLNHLDSCMAVKDLISVDRYGGYRRMKMYYKGNFDDLTDTTRVKFFFRIGRDEFNYYEYATLVDTLWDQVNLDFNEITAVKDSALRSLGEGQQAKDINVTSGKYSVLGNPNINEVRYFVAGVVNLDDSKLVSGSLWLDELRVTDVRKDVGTAGRITVSGSLADLLTYNVNYISKDAFFRKLSTSTRGGSSGNLGSGQDEKTFGFGLSLKLNKFLPRSWGASLPISFNYSKRVTTPLLRTNSDIVLPEEIRKLEESVNEARTVTVSASFNSKSKNPLFTVLLNRLKTRFSYRRNKSKSVRFPYSFGENVDFSANYNLSIKQAPKVGIFFWTKSIPILRRLEDSPLFLYPTSWTTSMAFSRNMSISDDINYNRRSSIKRDMNGSMKVTYKLFPSLTVSYNYDSRRDLSDLTQVNWNLKNLKLGLETHFSQRFNLSYSPKLFKFLTHSFTYNANYSDDWEPSNQSLRTAINSSTNIAGLLDHISLFGGATTGEIDHQSRARGSRAQTRRGTKDAAKKTKKKKPFYDPPLAVLRFMTGWIKPVKYTYTETYRNSLSDLAGRPVWRYRFGLDKETDVERVEGTRPQSAGEGSTFDLSSSFTLLGGLSTRVSFKRAISKDIIKRGNLYENTSINWPDLNVTIRKFRTFPLFKKYVNKFIDVFSPKTGFSRKSKETFNLGGGFLTSKVVTVNYKPLISFNFRLFKSLALSSSYNYNTNTKETYNPTNGSPQSVTVSEKSTFALSAKYSFTSPTGIKIPLLGRLKFRSTVDISTNIKFNSSKTETSNNNGAFRPSIDKSDFSVSPVIAYTFSNQIKGGLTFRWQDSSDKTRNRKTHTREVQLWTEIRF